jgi:hypothetical protein
MLAVARTTTLRRNAITTRVVAQQTKRGMAGGHGPKPEWTGLDKTVRTYFPEDYQGTSLLLCKFQIPFFLSCPSILDSHEGNSMHAVELNSHFHSLASRALLMKLP